MIWVVGFVLVIAIGLVVVSLVAAVIAAVIELIVRVALGGALAAGLGIVAGVLSNEAGWDGALTGFLVSVSLPNGWIDWPGVKALRNWRTG